MQVRVRVRVGVQVQVRGGWGVTWHLYVDLMSLIRLKHSICLKYAVLLHE